MATLSAVDDAPARTGFRKRHRCAGKFRNAMYFGGCALLATASFADARTLYESDGIQLSGTASKVMRRAAICKSPGRQRNGKRLDVWRLDFLAVNGSGRQLDSLKAKASIASASPPCMLWHGPPASTTAFGAIEQVRPGESITVVEKPDGMKPGERVRSVVFVMVFHDDQPVFGITDVQHPFANPRCPGPTPLGCWKSGRVRVDPTMLLVAGRYTLDDKADAGEIDPFGNGTVNLEFNLAGIEIAFVPWRNKMRFGFNQSLGITRYEDSGLLMLSSAFFVQPKDSYRFELGWMHARSGKEDLQGPLADKTAFFFGVSFPVFSDKFRELLEKLN